MSAIREFARDVRAQFRIDRIILFGSVARGSLHEGSDIDLIVVGDFSERFHRRIAALLDLTDLPVEPFCYTPEEFEHLVEEQNPFILSALSEGVDL
ncbi:MAG: nucleotidyltransferase domain-containing protein [Methanofollis sp.]|nr:nucleotidyltransferase domain-containing protein [Methanofollis sp.]